MSMTLQVRNVSKRYGHDLVLHDIDLTFTSGEFVAIVGPSGSGKSTLLAILTGALDPDEGTVLVDRDATIDWEAVRRDRLAFVEQSHNLVPFLTAIENVAFALELREGPIADLFDRSRAELERLGLGHRLDGLPSELSGGERQRVAIARGMVFNPEFLVADEPTAALDGATTSRLASDLRRLVDELGVGVVVATHDPLLWDAADQVVRLRDRQVEVTAAEEAVLPPGAPEMAEARPPTAPTC